ncbi:hypothetical protein CANINC_000074 [Pichia inconspicua]|uniref:CENP-T/Histone H4 histone fold domain-containing protein n=1 Tax=Pichia inconspicua TaxID=52247 RepID=A0A4T0X7K5_9ASCO|nr:hypothetical protein CANINC_000074 [[Candida] inconspicua]
MASLQTPQRQTGQLQDATTRPTTPNTHENSFPVKSPRSPHSPRTPRRQLTPLTKRALEMSVTPTRNRLLFTPTRNKQTHVYDPLEDLRLLGRLFYNSKKVQKVRESTPVQEVPIEKHSLDHTSPTVLTVPSFVKKDVRQFAKLVDSSFTTASTSYQLTEDSLIEDTLPITQSQSQGQQTQQVDDLPDFDTPFDASFETTTTTIHADTSNVAIPEAILHDRSGIFGELSSDDDLLDEEQQYSFNMSIIDASSDEEGENRQRRVPARPRPPRPVFTNRQVKRACESLQIPEIPTEVFQMITERFIDVELERSVKLSQAAGLQRVVFTEVFDDNGGGEDERLVEVLKECDLETVKAVEGVLYGNATLRKKRKNPPVLREEGEGVEEGVSDESVDLSRLDSTIGLRIGSDGDGSDESSDYEIPLEEEE